MEKSQNNFRLGDFISRALGIVGVTEERVSYLLGSGCRCRDRRERYNRLGIWAARVVKGKVEKAREYLAEILDEKDGII